MPRKPLSKEQKSRMQSGRKATAEQRDAGLAALESNPQFTHPKFWALVDSEFQNAVVKAITKAQRGVKMAEIERLRKRIAKLETEV